MASTDFFDEKPPANFWLISGAALIWNLAGMMIYYMQVSATPEQLAANYSPEQVAFMTSTPVWATSAFAIAVTTGVLGSLMLLFRKALALPLFVLSLVAVVIQNVHAFVLNDARSLFGMTPVYIQTAIVVIAVFLIFYSVSAKKRRWLN